MKPLIRCLRRALDFAHLPRRSAGALLVVAAWLLVVSGCARTERTTGAPLGAHADVAPSLSPVGLATGERLRLVATTSIVSDVVARVGGELVQLTTLMPRGSDPHAFEPTPQDVTTLTEAHAVFINGVGLETFLEPFLEALESRVAIVPVSSGIALLDLTDGPDPGGQEDIHSDGGVDPHVWFDPLHVIIWTENIASALSAMDPDRADQYRGNAQAYETELTALDAWIHEQVATVPPAHRKLVTDHALLGYFAQRYGFEQVGALFPGFSTLAEPSAQDLAALEDAIREHGVRALFVGQTVNPDLAKRVAEDTGVRVVTLYTGSLSEVGGPADSYLALMRYDVGAIVEALQ